MMSSDTVTESSVKKSVTVKCSLEHAFEIFTKHIELWWPKEHHIGKSALERVTLEEKDGGRWFERCVDGSTCDWGRVLTYRPPSKVVLAWHLDTRFEYDPDPSHASRLEVTFHDLGGGQVRVDLVHSELEKHGAGWQKMRESLAGGWVGIMESYARTASSAAAS